MKNGTYHKDLGIPAAALRAANQLFVLNWSRHAQNACLTDRYGVIEHPPRAVKAEPRHVIEATLENLRVVKLVVRVSYCEIFDIVLVIVPTGAGNATVKTCWLNKRTDTHKTLDRSRYVIP